MSRELAELAALVVLPEHGTSYTKGVLCYAAARANWKTGKGWSSVATIARTVPVGETTARAELRRLEGWGAITLEAGGGRGRTNRFTVHRAWLERHVPKRRNPSPGEPFSKAETPRPATLNPSPGEPEPSNEPTEADAAGRSSATATAQAGRVAPPPDLKSETTPPVAARERSLTLAGPLPRAHAPDSGREGMRPVGGTLASTTEADRGRETHEARQGRAVEVPVRNGHDPSEAKQMHDDKQKLDALAEWLARQSGRHVFEERRHIDGWLAQLNCFGPQRATSFDELRAIVDKALRQYPNWSPASSIDAVLRRHMDEATRLGKLSVVLGGLTLQASGTVRDKDVRPDLRTCA